MYRGKRSEGERLVKTNAKTNKNVSKGVAGLSKFINQIPNPANAII